MLHRISSIHRLLRRFRIPDESVISTRSLSGNAVLDRCKTYAAGDKIHGYTVVKTAPVDELNLVSILLHHNETGAQHLHVGRDDKNNTFGVSFRTTPMDSTGVPHILEHTALCGSKCYPVRDPFFKMLNRSLSTFMNAMTSSDWTLYPFSSQNQKDFRNLMSVYLDAAFYPLLRENDFRQEGWRLEHEDIRNPNSPIIFKGIVFNEMKGVFSSQHSIFQEAVQNNLLPSHTYGVCSGGLPIDIPNLTWQALRDFHSSHYHPSNSRFYTYGDQPLETYLELIEQSILKNFNKIDVDTSVPRQPRWTEPRHIKISCRHNDMLPDPNKQTTVTASYLLSDIKDVYEASVLELLSTLLVRGENAPFYQSLIESSLGSGYAPVCGFEKSTRDTFFSIGLEGIAEQDTEKVLNIINETFAKVQKTGFPKERVEALLSQIELSTKHQTSSFGLGLLMSLTTPWNHDADPTELLQVNSILNRFRAEMDSNPTLLQDYIQKYFMENTHRLTVEMTPNENYEKELQAKETEKLKTLVEPLTEEDKAKILEKGNELANNQMTEEDISCLPTLRISDIDKDVKRTSINTVDIDGVHVQLCEQPTNEVVYFHALTDMSDLPSHLKPFVPLFCTLATRMGAGALDYKEQSQQIERYTGGLNVSYHLSASPFNLDEVQQTIHVSSFCLKDNIEPMFSLWSDIFNSLRLDDVERVSMLLKMCAADSVNSISYSGHRFAMCHSASGLSEMNRLNEVFTGVTQVSFLKAMAEEDQHLPLLGYLQSIADHILNKISMKCSINAEESMMDKATNQLSSFFSTIKGTPEAPPTHMISASAPVVPAADLPETKSPFKKTHFAMDFSVNYGGLSVPTVEFAHEDFATLRVLARLLTNKYLHREIREKGGAYGGGATGDSPGHLSFYSYRDPNSLKTVDTMTSSADWVASGAFNQEHVDEAILATFQKVDAPVAPGSKGLGVFLSGITDDMRQKHRDELRSVTVEKVKAASEKYLRNPPARGITLIGPENEQIKADCDWTISGREQCCQLPSL